MAKTLLILNDPSYQPVVKVRRRTETVEAPDAGLLIQQRMQPVLP